jgi:hypothetical protein
MPFCFILWIDLIDEYNCRRILTIRSYCFDSSTGENGGQCSVQYTYYYWPSAHCALLIHLLVLHKHLRDSIIKLFKPLKGDDF